MSNIVSTLTLVSLLGVVYLWSWFKVQWKARSRGLPLPPGPKPLPILGNVFSMPRSWLWIGCRDLGLVYGDILYFHILGRPYVVLQSAEVVRDYLHKRAANTSDRLHTPMTELSGSSYNLGFMPYGQWWRRHRRQFWQHFRPDAIRAYSPVQESTAHVFLQMLRDKPTDLKEICRYSMVSTLLKIGYDIDVHDVNDEYVNITKEALEGTMEGMVPGRFLVEVLPFLRHIPPWIPGAISQRIWAKWQAAGQRLKTVPFAHVKARLANNQGTESMAAKLLNNSLADTEISSSNKLEIIQNVLALSFAGTSDFPGMARFHTDFNIFAEAGTDTVLSAMLSVFLAVSMHPEVLRKAHAELDAVIGPHRLPNMNDMSSLIYVNAMITEALRWHVVAPFGIPHATTADDTFCGYFIPAGTVLIPNIWACMHDPDVYKDPDTFRPERFIKDGKLDTTVQDPADFVFGFGRRICPGRYFAINALFIHVACALHVFDITQPIDGDGKPLKIMPGHTDTLISQPEDFRCTIRPRNNTAEALIRSCGVSAHEEMTNEPE